MSKNLSQRLLKIVEALPLKDGMRILEIGCGPAAMARAIVKRFDSGHILAIDRSAQAIEQAKNGSKAEIESGRLSFKQIPIEDFELQENEQKFDMAVAIRVGALDGRHPEIEKQALKKIAKALKSNGKLYIDGGNPLKEISLDEFK